MEPIVWNGGGCITTRRDAGPGRGLENVVNQNATRSCAVSLCRVQASAEGVEGKSAVAVERLVTGASSPLPTRPSYPLTQPRPQDDLGPGEGSDTAWPGMRKSFCLPAVTQWKCSGSREVCTPMQNGGVSDSEQQHFVRDRPLRQRHSVAPPGIQFSPLEGDFQRDGLACQILPRARRP